MDWAPPQPAELNDRLVMSDEQVAETGCHSRTGVASRGAIRPYDQGVLAGSGCRYRWSRQRRTAEGFFHLCAPKHYSLEKGRAAVNDKGHPPISETFGEDWK